MTSWKVGRFYWMKTSRTFSPLAFLFFSNSEQCDVYRHQPRFIFSITLPSSTSFILIKPFGCAAGCFFLAIADFTYNSYDESKIDGAILLAMAGKTLNLATLGLASGAVSVWAGPHCRCPHKSLCPTLARATLEDYCFNSPPPYNKVNFERR